jgi:hypothetical protein
VFEGGISSCIRIRSPPASHLLLLPTTLIIGIQKVHINTRKSNCDRLTVPCDNMDLGPSKAEKERRGMIDRAEEVNNRAGKEREKARREGIAQGIAQEAMQTGEEVGGLNDAEFHNFKPPRRLLALEIIIIILFIMLLLINPNGFTAISMKGTDTVGLLSTSLPLPV